MKSRWVESSSILPETNSSPLKTDGWNTILSYWVSAGLEMVSTWCVLQKNDMLSCTPLVVGTIDIVAAG